MPRSLVWGLFALTACNGDPEGPGNDDTVLPSLNPIDTDQDGIASDADCNDSDAAVFPGASEQCNGLDDDCNGTIDDGLMVSYYRDADGDTYGDPDAMAAACSPPGGYVSDDTDCDDANRLVHPGGVEICDLQGTDEDCNGTANEADANTANIRTWYVDADEDGFGTSKTVESCFEQPGLATVASDCNDADFDINPGTPEVCDALDKDEDCDGYSDANDPEGPAGQPLYFVDADGDDDGDSDDPGQYFCDGVAPGYSTLNTDCDDTTDIINPRAPENCKDSIDNDCNGAVDDCGPIADIPVDTSDVIIEGVTTYAYFGQSVSSLGDHNGDGYQDFAVGSYQYDSGKGAVFAFDGPIATPGTYSAEDIYSATITGSVTYGGFAYSMSSAGDLNADGFDDVVVGMYSYDQGHAYTFLGPFVGDITATSADAIWSAEEYGDYGGKVVSGNFDFDANGTADYLMGAYYASSSSSYDVGAAYLVYGPGTGIDSSMADADVKFAGLSSYSYFGDSVSGLSDTNGDGADDLVVGAWQSSSSYGAVYVFNGGSLGGEVAASTADTIITGSSSPYYFGRSVSRATDFNADGYGDMLVTAPYAWSYYGSAFVFLGPLSSGDANSIAHAELYGEYSGSFSTNGGGLDGAGDINRDGYSDVLVGAPYYSPGGGIYSSGVGYLVYGPQTGDVSLANARCAFPGNVTNDQVGTSMAFIGDQTGDDSAEVLMGGPYATGYVGAAWMVFGDRL